MALSPLPSSIDCGPWTSLFCAPESPPSVPSFVIRESCYSHLLALGEHEETGDMQETEQHVDIAP